MPTTPIPPDAADEVPAPTATPTTPLDYAGRVPRYGRASRLATASLLVAVASPVLIGVLWATTVHLYVLFHRVVVSLGDVVRALVVLNVALPVASVVRIARSRDDTLRGVGRAVSAPFVFFGLLGLGFLGLMIAFFH